MDGSAKDFGNPYFSGGTKLKDVFSSVVNNWDTISGVGMMGMGLYELFAGAKSQATESKIGMKYAGLELDNNLEAQQQLPGLTQARKDIATDEYGLTMEQLGYKASTMHDEIYRNRDIAESSQKFAHSGEVMKDVDLMKKGLLKEFDFGRDISQQTMQKAYADATQWELDQEAKLKAEELKVRAQIDTYKATSSTWKALGF